MMLPFAAVRRCPKTGRIKGWPLLGLLATAWFLLRVVPKPSRAAYPCQRLASGIGAGFLSWVLTGVFTAAAYRFVRRNVAKGAATALAAVLAIGIYVGAGSGRPSAAPREQILTPAEGPNKPLGRARGIAPGRVVWEQDFAVAKWDGTGGHWWDDANVNQQEVDRMFSAAIRKLTDEKSDRAAWNKLFRFCNRANGRGDRAYRPGEKIVVKLNCNGDNGKPWGNRGYPTPHAVYTLVRQLIEVAGVPGDAIVLTDPSRLVGDPVYNKVRSNPRSDFQRVAFEGQGGQLAPQRFRPAPDMNSPVQFPMPDGKTAVLYLPKSFADAAYIINYALLRPHRVFGVTLSAKNHFGSVYDPDLKSFKPTRLHAFALWDYETPNKQGQPHSHPNLLGHRLTGGKTLLYFLDGLYTPSNQSAEVVRWSTFGNRWFSSMLMSLDPVAIDSVGYDLITSEPNLTKGNPSFNGNADSYLHEAALAEAPPSGAKYAPEGGAAVLTSLGVHEHWNNAKDRQYSRNLGRKQGIELVALK